MKKSTIIGLTVGGLIVVGGGVLAYVKREALKALAFQVADEAKKLLKKNKMQDDPSTETAEE